MRGDALAGLGEYGGQQAEARVHLLDLLAAPYTYNDKNDLTSVVDTAGRVNQKWIWPERLGDRVGRQADGRSRRPPRAGECRRPASAAGVNAQARISPCVVSRNVQLLPVERGDPECRLPRRV